MQAAGHDAVHVGDCRAPADAAHAAALSSPAWRLQGKRQLDVMNSFEQPSHSTLSDEQQHATLVLLAKCTTVLLTKCTTVLLILQSEVR